METIPSKHVIDKKVKEIAKMDIDALRSSACDISVSLIDYESRCCLNRAIDLRFAELQGIDTNGLDVVCSEVKADEVGL